jgi:hypothetical protein
MSGSEAWQTILTVLGALGGIGVITGTIAAFIGKLIASRVTQNQKAMHAEQLEQQRHQYSRELEQQRHQYSRDIETFKDQLQRATQEHENRLQRAEREYDMFLQRIAREHEIRFSKLHEQRASAIVRRYALLYKAQIQVVVFVMMLQVRFEAKGKENEFEEEEKVRNKSEEVGQIIEQIRDFSIDNKLLFGDRLSHRIDKLIGVLGKPTLTHALFKVDPIKYQEELSSVTGNVQQMLDNIVGLLGPVEKEFRILLGTEEPQQTQS